VEYSHVTTDFDNPFQRRLFTLNLIGIHGRIHDAPAAAAAAAAACASIKTAAY
jgi:hypothetical protein